jgi:hypothetical protein
LAQTKILLDAWAPIVRLQLCYSELQQGDFHPQRKERKLESWTKSLRDTIDYRGSTDASDSSDDSFITQPAPATCILVRISRLKFDVRSVYSKVTMAVIEYYD